MAIKIWIILLKGLKVKRKIKCCIDRYILQTLCTFKIKVILIIFITKDKIKRNHFINLELLSWITKFSKVIICVIIQQMKNK